MLEVLKGVVESGTGTRAAVDGVTIAGKTGTAEHDNQESDSWFVGIGDADGEPSVVVAIELEHVGHSASAAAQSQQVMETALEVQGVL